MVLSPLLTQGKILDKSFSSIRPCYLPKLSFFWKIAQCDYLLFADHLQYVKRSDISVSPALAGDNHRLHIPVRHNGQPVPICQKEIDGQSHWSRKHWQTIRHLFHNYPFAEYYFPEMGNWYGTPNVNLADFLYLVLTDLLRFLNLPLIPVRVSRLDQHFSGNEALLISLARHWHTQTYIGEIRDPLNLKTLHQAGLKTVPFHSLPDSNLFKSYGSLSVLEFLFQFGPEAGYILRQYLARHRKSGRTNVKTS